MNDTLVLSRYKDKNPPAKQAVETQKVKSKVDKANKKRRPESMVKLDPRYEQRLAELDGESERMRLARSLNSRADEIMKHRNITDYTEAVRLAHEEQEQDVTLTELEAYAEKYGVPADGDAFRSLQMDRLHRAQSHGVPVTSAADDEAEMRRIAQERGYGDL